MRVSEKRGKNTLECEVVNISPFGVWVLVEDSEYFLDHVRYPWFQNANVLEVLSVESPRYGHLRWPALDIDLHLDCFESPEKYPLVAKKKSKK